ncbi:MAG: hypothetical protein ACO1Q7_04925 [Gemmatimonas sp.]
MTTNPLFKNAARARRGVFAALISAAALVVTACDGGSSTGPAPAEVEGAIRIRNDASISVYYAYFKACGTTSWGEDRLGTNVVVPGSSRSLSVPNGCYDVRVRSSNQLGKLMDKPGVQISGGQTVEVRVTEW